MDPASGHGMSGPTTNRFEALTADLNAMQAELAVAKAELDVRAKLKEMEKTLAAHDKSLSSGMMRREAWYKRHAILIPFIFSAAAAAVTWWVTNDRAQVRAQIEHENTHDRIVALEHSVETLGSQAMTQQLHVTRVKTMLELLLRKQNLRVPAPVEGEP